MWLWYDLDWRVLPFSSYHLTLLCSTVSREEGMAEYYQCLNLRIVRKAIFHLYHYT